MLKCNIEILSDILNFACCHIIVGVVIIIIVRDVVDDVGCVATLTVVLSIVTLSLMLT